MHAILSTADVAASDAFAYWQDQICARFVRLTAQRLDDGPFHGRIDHVSLGALELSLVEATGQVVRRTRTLIGRDDGEYLLASVLLDGGGRIEQDGRVAELQPGAMAFYDSTRPYTLRSDRTCRLLVVKVPRRRLLGGDTRDLTARTLGAGSPGGVVSVFLRSLFAGSRNGATEMALLGPHAIGLLSAAAAFAARDEAPADAREAVARQRVYDVLHQHFADPQLDASAVARACNMSRRSLYRLAGAEGVAGRLRRIRIEHAKVLLLGDTDRPISAIAMDCGFDSESGFYRAFRAATGSTPGDYRREGTADRLASGVRNVGTPGHTPHPAVEHHLG